MGWGIDAFDGTRSDAIELMVDEGALWPILDVNGCAFCGNPSRREKWDVCGTCIKMRKRHRRSLNRLEVVTLSTDREGFQPLIALWKDHWGAKVDDWQQLAPRVAAPLSSYLESAAERLRLSHADTILSWIPSSTGVIPNALKRAEGQGWFAPEATSTGCAKEGLPRQRLMGERRVDRRPEDWIVEAQVEGKRVVVMDDVYTSGASLHSYAGALKKAGANEVTGVALNRNITGMVYQEAMRGSEARWDPEDCWIGEW